MKTKRFLVCGLMAVISLAFVACGGSGAETSITYTGSKDGETYSLEITKNTNRAAYTPVTGDNYILTLGGKISTGTVSGVNGNVLTLKPSNSETPFTATISGNTLVSLTGTITYTDNTTGSAPGELTPSGGGGGGGSISGPTTWIAVADSTFGTTSIRAIAYGNNRFVAVGDEGKMAYSDDGENWTAAADSIIWKWKYDSSTTVYTAAIFAIAYDNGRFVAGGGRGKMAYSDDNGVTWKAVADSKFPSMIVSSQTVADDLNIRAIAYGDGRFVAGGGAGKMAYSTDGANWTAVADSTFYAGGATANYIYGIAYGNNRFVAGGFSGQMAYSTDGETWTAVADSIFGTDNIYGIAYEGGRFVAGGSRGKMAYADW